MISAKTKVKIPDLKSYFIAVEVHLNTILLQLRCTSASRWLGTVPNVKVRSRPSTSVPGAPVLAGVPTPSTRTVSRDWTPTPGPVLHRMSGVFILVLDLLVAELKSLLLVSFLLQLLIILCMVIPGALELLFILGIMF